MQNTFCILDGEVQTFDSSIALEYYREAYKKRLQCINGFSINEITLQIVGGYTMWRTCNTFNPCILEFRLVLAF